MLLAKFKLLRVVSDLTFLSLKDEQVGFFGENNIPPPHPKSVQKDGAMSGGVRSDSQFLLCL